MSTTIDNRVVEMRFDNKQFESATAQSMSTIDKLKQKLKFSDSSKGLENLGTAAKKVDMTTLGNSVETVRARFSALQIMGVTALANITNQAVNAGKRIASALTIDPIKTGFQEYETQINSVQTILANTQHAGTTIDDVTKALDQLNTYADKTIYNFTEMTRNIGTFTAAGIDLDTSVNAIQGIANLAAVSGSTSQQASTAMYQLSQALAAGTVKLMDWNSVVNAGMGGKVFQDALTETARVHGIAIDDIIKKQGSFRESLSEGWITSDILTETLEKFTMSTEGLTEAEIELARQTWRTRGYTEDQIDAIFKLGDTATNAATKVKTFTQLWDVLKESAQSGWAKTWQLIIGDFEEAKTVWTSVSDVLTGFINKMNDARNKLLESALGMGFDKLKKSLQTALGPIEKVVDSTKNVTKTIDDLGKLVDEVIIGKFGNGEERYEKLTKAGKNYYKIQNEVNKTLGDGFRYSKKKIAAQDKLLSSQRKTTKETEKAEKATGKLTDAQKKQIKEIVKLSKEQMKSAGYTDDQIAAFEELKKVADDLGLPLEELIDNLDEINGRWLLLRSFANIGETIGKVWNSVADAFRDVFGYMKPETLFDMIAGFHKLTSQMIISDETADKLQRTFRGLFSIVDIVSRILGGGLKIALSVLSGIFKAFGITALDVTANVGDLLYKFDEWLKKNDPIVKTVEKLSEKIQPVVEGIKEFAEAIWVNSGAADNFHKIADGLESIWIVVRGGFTYSLNAFIRLLTSFLGLFGTNLGEVLGKMAEWVTAFGDWLDTNTLFTHTIDKMAKILKRVVDGFKGLFERLKESKVVREAITKLLEALSKFIDKIKEVFNINFDGGTLESLFNLIDKFFAKIESWLKSDKGEEMFLAGVDIITGLVNGITSGIDKVVSVMQDIGNRIIEAIKNVLGIHSPSTVMYAIGAFLILGLLMGILSGEIELFAAVRDIAVTIVSTIFDVFQNGLPYIIDVVKSIGTKLFDALKEWDISLGSLIAVGIVGTITVMVVKLYKLLEKIVNPLDKLGGLFDAAKDAINRFGKKTKVQNFAIIAKSILSIGIAIGILAGSFYLLAQLDWKEVGRGAVALIAISGALALLATAASKLDGFEVGKLAGFMLSFSAAVWLISASMRMLSKMDDTGAAVAIMSMLVIVGGMGAIVAAFGKYISNPKNAAEMDKAGIMFKKMAVAVLLMALAIKLMASIPMSDLGKATGIIAGVLLIFVGFTKLSEKAKWSGDVGNLMLKIAGSIILMGIAIRMLAGISTGDIVKGMAVIAGIEILFFLFAKACSGLKWQSKLNPADMFIKMAIAIGIMAVAIRIIAGLSMEDILKGLICIDLLSTLMRQFIKFTATYGPGAAQAGITVLGMAAGIAVLALVIKLIGTLSLGDIVKGIIVIGALELLLVGMVKISNLGSNFSAGAGKSIFLMSTAILMLVGAIAILAMLDPKDVVRGTACISALVLSFAALSIATNFIGDCMKQLIVMTAAIGILATALIILANIDPENVKTATIALSSVIGMLSILTVATKFAGKVSGSMFALVGVIALLSGVLILMSKMEVEASINNAIALSILAVAMSGCMAILSLIDKNTKGALMGALALTAMAVPLMAFVGVLAVASNVENATKNAIALAGLATAMTLLLIPLTVIGAIATTGIGALAIVAGILALTAMAIPMLAFVGILSKMSGIENATGNAKLLTSLLETLTETMAVLAKVGPFALIGVTAMTGLVLLMGAIGTLATIVGGIMTAFPQLEDFLNKGIPILEKLAYAVGSFAGNLIKGFSEAVASALPRIGMQLSAFMVGAMPFINGVKMVDETVLKGVGILAASIGVLCAVNLIENMTKFISLGDSFGSLGGELSRFATSALPFFVIMQSVKPETFEGIKSLTSAILELTAANFLEGITRFLGFGGSFADFGTQLPILGGGIRSFVEALGTLSPEQLESIKLAGDAIKALVDAGSKIEGQPNWAKNLFGDNSLTAFTSQLPVVALSLKSFVTNLGTFTDEQVTTIKSAGNAIKALAEAGSQIDGQGEWAKSLFGDNSLSAFTADLPLVALSLKSFVTNLGTFTEDQVTSVKCAGNAIKALAEAGSNIDGQADWAKKLFGDNGLGAFSSELPGVAKNLKSFISNLGTFNEGSIATTNAAVGVVKALAKLGNSDLSSLSTYLPLVGEKMIDFADDLASFCDKMSDVSSDGIADKLNGLVKSVSGAAKKIGQKKTEFSKAGTSLINALGSGIDQKKTSIKTKFTNAVNSAKTGITDKKKEFTKAGKTLGGALIDGFEEKKDAAEKAGGSLANKAKTGARDKYDNFKSAGSYLAQGLINGLTSQEKMTAAYNAGYKLGAKAAEGVDDGAGNASPSKKGRQSGIYIGEGLIIGLNKMGQKVFGAGYDMGELAANALTGAVSRLSDIVNRDMDTQPTITPVLDLSEVQNGVGAIDGMFGFAPSIGVMSRLGSINASMNQRNQNGINGDVVSAINKLGKTLGNVGGDTYNINGINYEEGSDVAEALVTITRAAIRERRV